MKRTKRLIKFASSHEYVTPPVPAHSAVPSWYKKIPRFSDGSSSEKLDDNGRFSNRTVKHCFPFLDALTSGYVAELWQDIEVSRNMSGPNIQWPVEPQPIGFRSGEGLETFPTPPGCYKTQFFWQSPFTFKTPPGYSVLVTHPLNRIDLPFVTMSGIIDSDTVVQEGNVPFYLSEDFEGIIEAGTPIFQIIPFKREDWVSSVDQSLVSESKKSRWLSFRSAKAFYRDTSWQRKKYE